MKKTAFEEFLQKLIEDSEEPYVESFPYLTEELAEKGIKTANELNEPWQQRAVCDGVFDSLLKSEGLSIEVIVRLGRALVNKIAELDDVLHFGCLHLRVLELAERTGRAEDLDFARQWINNIPDLGALAEAKVGIACTTGDEADIELSRQTLLSLEQTEDAFQANGGYRELFQSFQQRQDWASFQRTFPAVIQHYKKLGTHAEPVLKSVAGAYVPMLKLLPPAEVQRFLAEIDYPFFSQAIRSWMNNRRPDRH